MGLRSIIHSATGNFAQGLCIIGAAFASTNQVIPYARDQFRGENAKGMVFTMLVATALTASAYLIVDGIHRMTVPIKATATPETIPAAAKTEAVSAPVLAKPTPVKHATVNATVNGTLRGW